MNGDKWIRRTLWLSFPFNMGAAVMLAFPASGLGQLVEMPEAVPAIYRALASGLVALFGFAYAWLAMQQEIDRPLVAFSAIGKAGVFLLAVALALGAVGSWKLVPIAGVDLAFALVWFNWLRIAVRANC